MQIECELFANSCTHTKSYYLRICKHLHANCTHALTCLQLKLNCMYGSGPIAFILYTCTVLLKVLILHACVCMQIFIRVRITNLSYEIFIKELNVTWRRHANQLCTRIECVPETNSESPLTVEQSSARRCSLLRDRVYLQTEVRIKPDKFKWQNMACLTPNGSNARSGGVQVDTGCTACRLHFYLPLIIELSHGSYSLQRGRETRQDDL